MNVRPIPSRLPFLASAIALCAFAGTSLPAATFTWTPTAPSTTYNWNDPANWNPSTGFPTAAGDVANLNNDIAGNQTIRLRQDITLGILNSGDADTGTAFAFTIANATGESSALTFDSGAASLPAQINLSSSGTVGNTLAVPVLLNSNIQVNLGTSGQTLTLSSAGSLAMGSGAAARNVTLTGGTASNQVTLNGDLSGSGVFTNNSNAAVIIGGTKSFTGTFVLNKGVGGSNTGSLTLTTGSIANAAEVVINGFLGAPAATSASQNGGSLHSGNGSAAASNPGQRLTQNRITLNGGTLTAGGQALVTPSLI